MSWLGGQRGNEKLMPDMSLIAYKSGITTTEDTVHPLDSNKYSGKVTQLPPPLLLWLDSSQLSILQIHSWRSDSVLCKDLQDDLPRPAWSLFPCLLGFATTRRCRTGLRLKIINQNDSRALTRHSSLAVAEESFSLRQQSSMALMLSFSILLSRDGRLVRKLRAQCLQH